MTGIKRALELDLPLQTTSIISMLGKPTSVYESYLRSSVSQRVRYDQRLRSIVSAMVLVEDALNADELSSDDDVDNQESTNNR